jgi:hypothetical protein
MKFALWRAHWYTKNKPITICVRVHVTVYIYTPLLQYTLAVYSYIYTHTLLV